MTLLVDLAAQSTIREDRFSSDERAQLVIQLIAVRTFAQDCVTNARHWQLKVVGLNQAGRFEEQFEKPFDH
jgi:hypothetical protein